MSKQDVEVDERDFVDVDWSTTSFPIGVTRGDGQEQWLALSADELEILYKLLVTKLPLRNEDGSISMHRATDGSDGLTGLAVWARVARHFKAVEEAA